jgi:preprotein translocase subunit SecA
MLRFGTDRVKGLIQTMGLSGENAIRSGIFTKAVESAQKRVEGNNFDIRKQLLQYDNVMNEQREIIYGSRNQMLELESIREYVTKSFKEYITRIVNNYINFNEDFKENDRPDKIDNYKELVNHINETVARADIIKDKDIKEKAIEEIESTVLDKFIKHYEEKIKEVPIEIINEFEKAISLKVIDMNWMNHISNMEHLREGIGLRGYANINPLQAYIKEGYETFDEMLNKISEETSLYLLRAEVRKNAERKEVAKPIKNNSGEKSSGVVRKDKKVGRNDSCPCGSGKKYKHCCGK